MLASLVSRLRNLILERERSGRSPVEPLWDLLREAEHILFFGSRDRRKVKRVVERMKEVLGVGRED